MADVPKVQALTEIVIPVIEESKLTAVNTTIPDNADTNKVFKIFPFLYEKYKRKSK